MKKVILILGILVAFAANNLFSQDVIVKRDGSQIKGKVTDIEGNLIKYKPFDFLEGPTRSVPLPDVDRIVYESGRIENFVIVETPKEVPVQQNVVSQQPVNQEQQEEQTEKISVYRPVRILGRISGQIWHDDGLSEFFGTNVLYGAGIEKQLSNHFILGADADFASKTVDDVTLTYSQFGGFIKFSWATFGVHSPLLYSQLGVRAVSIKAIEDDYSGTATGAGFSFLLGFEIPLGKKVALNLAWDTVLGNVSLEGEQINIWSEIFSGGLIFSF